MVNWARGNTRAADWPTRGGRPIRNGPVCVCVCVRVSLLLRACNSRLGAVAELSSADWRGPTWPHRLGQHDPISDNCDPYFI